MYSKKGQSVPPDNLQNYIKQNKNTKFVNQIKPKLCTMEYFNLLKVFHVLRI